VDNHQHSVDPPCKYITNLGSSQGGRVSARTGALPPRKNSHHKHPKTCTFNKKLFKTKGNSRASTVSCFKHRQPPNTISTKTLQAKAIWGASVVHASSFVRVTGNSSSAREDPKCQQRNTSHLHHQYEPRSIKSSGRPGQSARLVHTNRAAAVHLKNSTPAPPPTQEHRSAAGSARRRQREYHIHHQML
jgi:hypothetical protein